MDGTYMSLYESQHNLNHWVSTPMLFFKKLQRLHASSTASIMRSIRTLSTLPRTGQTNIWLSTQEEEESPSNIRSFFYFVFSLKNNFICKIDGVVTMSLFI
ncbi:hypothetical protein PYW07_000136 [Mythimna separata]|uniref:Uncharacterized protein n=1 Tax=Mythimna separata TaxID=271217 RepID=A0AAD7Z3D1_MYTSE|nr:hypothetical protein PYW07_000136 [Mythimna separata]